jgi:hypothetical protein
MMMKDVSSEVAVVEEEPEVVTEEVIEAVE